VVIQVSVQHYYDGKDMPTDLYTDEKDFVFTRIKGMELHH
jgi:hypothetical protein